MAYSTGRFGKAGPPKAIDDGNEGKGNDGRRRKMKRRTRDANRERRGGSRNSTEGGARQRLMKKRLRAAHRARAKAQRNPEVK
jgi:hypothetical protein